MFLDIAAYQLIVMVITFLFDFFVIPLLKVNVRRAVKGRNEMDVSMSAENGHSSSMMGSLRPPIVRKSKLVVVDLAGSERIDKSGECILIDKD
jgi:hypothetical protein